VTALVSPPQTHPEEYVKYGLGPLPAETDPKDLYIDAIKRSVANILYEDLPVFFYDGQRQPVLASGFDLRRRVLGEDGPTSAHTMIGVRRLESLQACLESVLRENIAGDIVETGVLRGGASIFMRAVLKAHGALDRCVFVCDTFQQLHADLPRWLQVLFKLVASLPSLRLQKMLFMRLQAHIKEKSFPTVAEPSDEMIRFVMWTLKNHRSCSKIRGASLEDVRSNFARYGLLDEQVIFLKGLFADTLPVAPLEQIALMRLDGDTFESTRDALALLYPKLSARGYCVIDDYNSFPDCRRAVINYREAHGIEDEIVRIDNLAVYWRKAERASSRTGHHLGVYPPHSQSIASGSV
jgi:O-methyltransferase